MPNGNIRIEDVDVDYPISAESARRVLHGIDVDIPGGEFVSIVGETGCGKSTLLRLILGEEQPTRGRVMVKLNVGQRDLEKVIALLPAMKAPTVNPLHDAGYFAVETVVPKDKINVLIPELKAAGASDIVEMPITKIVP